jgi:hypothetical protein
MSSIDYKAAITTAERYLWLGYNKTKDNEVCCL